MKINYKRISEKYPSSIFYKTPMMKRDIKKLYEFFFEGGEPFHSFIENQINKAENLFTEQEKNDILDAKYCENLFFFDHFLVF